MSIRRVALAVARLGVAFGLVGCGGSSASKSTTAPGTSAPATNPAPTTTRPATTATRTQTPPPGALQAKANSAATGDIRDNQVFLAFRNPLGGWSMKYPEGWAQSGSGKQIAFRDKNNIVRVVVVRGSAPTPAAVRRDLAKLGGVHVQGAPQQPTLPSGPALKVVYTTESAPNGSTSHSRSTATTLARELVALFGPSGSGKSTALHLAAALDEPSAGEVRVFGRSLTRLDEPELARYRGRHRKPHRQRCE